MNCQCMANFGNRLASLEERVCVFFVAYVKSCFLICNRTLGRGSRRRSKKKEEVLGCSFLRTIIPLLYALDSAIQD